MVDPLKIKSADIRKAAMFDTPSLIPMTFHVNPSCWAHYPTEALLDVMESHPLLFPDFERSAGGPDRSLSPVQIRDAPYLDPWECLWKTSEDGIVGTVVSHPLADWDRFAEYRPPDPESTDGLVPNDWPAFQRHTQSLRGQGALAMGGLPHGHTFMRLCDIRGYQALMLDMMMEDDRLARLMEMVSDFNLALVQRQVEAGVDWMSFPEDLGMQNGPMISPDLFRRHIQPIYRRVMRPACDAGCIVHMHSDGDIRLLIDDLLACGLRVLNLQDRVNGVDWIARRLAGKVCIELDIDRQFVTRFGSPGDIDTLIREEVEKLGRREGGLMMIYGLYPGVPMKNIHALADAMERYAGWFD